MDLQEKEQNSPRRVVWQATKAAIHAFFLQFRQIELT